MRRWWWTIAVLVRTGLCDAQVPENGWAFAMSGGFALQPDRLELFGHQLAASTTLRVRRALAVRAEVATTGLVEIAPGTNAPCPIEAGPGGCGAPDRSIRIRSLTFGAVLPREGRGYGMLGTGAHYFVAHPQERGRVRPGLFGALGRAIGGALTIEAQLHWVPVPHGAQLTAPVRIGVTF